MDILFFAVIVAFYLYGVAFATLYIQNIYNLNKYTIKFISNKNKFKIFIFILGSWSSLVFSLINKNR